MVSVCVLALVSPVYGGVSGVIAGKIFDAGGTAIPGVTITVIGQDVAATRVDTTSLNGLYRMPELPPGIYTVQAEIMGMQSMQRQNVRVSLNNTTRVNFTMEMETLAVFMDVVASAELMSVKSATVKTTLERSVTERMPGSDDLFSAFSMAGGITGGGNVRVHGGAQTDNLYLFDGVDTTDPLTSTFGANLNADAIQEVEVQTGGFQAEYGRSMGGIVNAVTRSGSNDIHGIFRIKYINSDWREDFDHPRATAEFDFFEPTLTLDGPLWRDRLFFMVTYSYSNSEGTNQTIGFYGADPQNDNDYTSIMTDREFHLPYAKLTFQLNQDHKIVVNYSGEDATIYGTNGDPEINTPESWNVQEQGGPFYSAEWTWLYSSSLYFISRIGGSFGYLNSMPMKQVDDGGRNASFNDLYHDQVYNNSQSWSEDERNRIQMSFTANYFKDDLMGSHEIKSGLEWHDLSVKQFNVYPGGAQYIITQVPDNADDPSYYTGTEATRNILLHPGTAETSGNYLAFFVQDDWAIMENLTLNVGLRYERVSFENDVGDTSVPAWDWGQFKADTYREEDGTFKNYTDMKFDNMLAPRLGLNWDIFGNGTTALHGFYGRFYNPFNLSLPDMLQPFSANTFAEKKQEYAGPAWSDMDRDGIPDEDFFFDDSNWTTYQEDNPEAWNMLDPDLEPEYTDEVMFSVEHAIMRDFSLGVTYTYRKTNDMIEDVGLFTDEYGNIVWTYRGGIRDDFSGLDPDKYYDPVELPSENSQYSNHIYWITNPVNNYRKYNGFELNARARLEHFDLQGSYTYATAKGSVIEAQEGYNGISQFSGQYDTVGTSVNLYGELPWSARHYVKVAGSAHYDITKWYELSLGINAFWRSGYHYSKRSKPPLTYDELAGNDINDSESWTGKPPYRAENWHFMEPRGEHELPSFYNIDLSVQNAFQIGKYGTATLIFDIFNVTDYQGIVGEAETYNPKKPDIFGQANQWGNPRTYRLSLKYAF